jgi:hypothetical protein
VGAVRGGKGIVDEKIAVCGQRPGEFGVVLLLALVKAGVFQKQDVALVHVGDRGRRPSADAVGREMDGAVEDCLRRACDGLERHVGDHGALGATEMREQDHLGSLVGKLGDGRRNPFDAGGVGDRTVVVERHVEIDAHEHALSLGVDVVQRAECGHVLVLRG